MFVNLTPHKIVIQRADGTRITIPPSGVVARVAAIPGLHVSGHEGVPIFGAPSWGAIEGLPEPVAGAVFIVSGVVAGRVSRGDVVSPGTGPDDGAIRGPGGQIEAVTRLIRSRAR